MRKCRNKNFSFFITCKTNKVNPNLHILFNKLEKFKIYKLSLPLKNHIRIIMIMPWLILYPFYKFTLTQAYIYLKSKIKNCRYIIGYSILPRSIQELNNKWRGIRTIQIQSGYLGEELSTDKIDDITKLRNVDLFLGMSNFQCNLAKTKFAKEVKNVGLLSSEEWISNNKITCDLSGYKYDLCLVLNTKNSKSIKYIFKLIINYIKDVKEIKCVITLKSKSDINFLIQYCNRELKFNILNYKSIKINPFSAQNYSTLNAALDSKIILGYKSTTLYQLGALGNIIYPINVEDEFNGNLIDIDMNVRPTQQEFNMNISYLLQRKIELIIFRGILKICKVLMKP